MITSRAEMLVNAHAPFKDGTLFSNHCVFVWTSKNDSKPQRVDADVLKKGAKKISVFRQERIRVDGAKVEQKFTFSHFTFSVGRGAGLTKEYPSITQAIQFLADTGLLYSGTFIQGTPSGPWQVSPERRLGWSLLIINQQIKYFSFILPRNLLQSLHFM